MDAQDETPPDPPIDPFFGIDVPCLERMDPVLLEAIRPCIEAVRAARNAIRTACEGHVDRQIARLEAAWPGHRVRFLAAGEWHGHRLEVTPSFEHPGGRRIGREHFTDLRTEPAPGEVPDILRDAMRSIEDVLRLAESQGVDLSDR